MDFYQFLKNKAIEQGIEKFVVAAIITNKKGQVFLAKRKKDDFMGGIYEIPGGNTNKGENIYDTLVREIKEETNLTVDKVTSYIDQFDYLSSSCKKCRQFNFKVEVTGDKILLTEHDTYKWIDLKDIENESSISPELKQSLLVYKFNQEQADQGRK